MQSIYKNNISLSLFGESHNENIGFTINGLPAGLKIDYEFIDNELRRRKPDTDCSNARIEKDDYKVISGEFEGYTTGEAFTILVKNENINSSTYEKGLFRPSHCDYPAYVRSKGYNDYRGGGHFSGRLTILLVIAGAICKEILIKKNIIIGSHISQIGNIVDEMNESNIESVFKNQKTIDISKYQEMCELVKDTMEKKDSIGGQIEAVISGIPCGVGEPFFDSIESVLSHLLFSIPACKAVEFGEGVHFKEMLGSEAKDEIHLEKKLLRKPEVSLLSNHNGGINGGLSNGNKIIVRATFKPTPTISLPEQTINLEKKENVLYTFSGKHDACCALRSDVIVESVIAIGLVDLLMSYYITDWIK